MYEFRYLEPWSKSLGSGGMDSWDNFIPGEDMDYYDRNAIAYTYAPDAGIPMQESNFEVMLKFLNEADPENVEEGRIKHWTYSYFKAIIVRLYNNDGEPTIAALEADEMLDAIHSYGCIDDGDVYEREIDAFIGSLTNYGIPESIVYTVAGYYGGDFRDVDGSIYVNKDKLSDAVISIMENDAIDPEKLDHYDCETLLDFIERDLEDDIPYRCLTFLEDLIDRYNYLANSKYWSKKVKAWENCDLIDGGEVEPYAYEHLLENH